MASSSIGGWAMAAAGEVRATGDALRPHTSIAHSSTAGPGRPLPIARNACADEARGLRRRADAGGEIDQAGDDAGLVADLVQMAEPATDRRLRNLADQRQHRRVHSIGGQQRRRGIEQSRPRYHRIGLRLAGRKRGTERHIGRALLVPGMDGANAVRAP